MSDPAARRDRARACPQPGPSRPASFKRDLEPPPRTDCTAQRAMLNETSERFLKAILERVPAERIVEIHLFPRHPAGPDRDRRGRRRGRAGPRRSSSRSTRRASRCTPRAIASREREPKRGKWEIEVKTQADAPHRDGGGGRARRAGARRRGHRAPAASRAGTPRDDERARVADQPVIDRFARG